jgi:hypothetical protein
MSDIVTVLIIIASNNVCQSGINVSYSANARCKNLYLECVELKINKNKRLNRADAALECAKEFNEQATK